MPAEDGGPAADAGDDPAEDAGPAPEAAEPAAAPADPAAGRSGSTTSMYDAPEEPASASTPAAAVHFELRSVGSPNYTLGPWRSSTTRPCPAFDVTPSTWESNW